MLKQLSSSHTSWLRLFLFGGPVLCQTVICNVSVFFMCNIFMLVNRVYKQVQCNILKKILSIFITVIVITS